MGNLISVLAHCGRGGEVILGDQSHTFCYEAGGISALGGVHPHTIPNAADGTLAVGRIEAAIRPDNVHFPRTQLICLENTQNRCCGAVLPPAYMEEVADLAVRYQLPIHLDGARIFNAAVALGVDARVLTTRVDSLTFCLSKGLSAPIGSVVCGSKDFVAEARRIRKVLGGGMRQAGIIAAAGIVALEEMVERLREDHEDAARLAQGIEKLDGFSIDRDRVQTNIVYFDVTTESLTAEAVVAGLAAQGVQMLALGPGRIRAVTHYGIDSGDIDRTLAVMAEVVQVT